MKLASLKEGGRDGTLIVVNRDLTRAVRATGIAPTLQAALEDWSNVAPRLNALYEGLQAGKAGDAFELDVDRARLAACRVPMSSSMAAPTCRTWRVCAARVAPKCRKASTPIR